MTSLWLDAAPAPRPPLEAGARADVAIVGGGVAGVAAALALRRAGASVTLVEGRGIAQAASGRNAGFVLAGIAENFVAATRRYGEERAARVWAFTRRNQERLRAIVAQEGIACELAWNGSLQIAGDDAEWAEVRESARRVAARGARVALEPAARAARYLDDGEVHPVKLVAGLAAAAERLGAHLHERTRATELSPGVVHTDRGELRAEAVVVCANAYAPHLVPARVRAVRGQMLATAPFGRRVFEVPSYAHRGYRYWRQTQDGRVVVGGWRDLAPDEEVGEEERTTDRIQSALDGFLRAHGVDAAVTHRWGGIMGFSHDGLPYVGRIARGVYLCAGFTGHGLGFALAAADLVADLVGGRANADTDLFDPERA